MGPCPRSDPSMVASTRGPAAHPRGRPSRGRGAVHPLCARRSPHPFPPRAKHTTRMRLHAHMARPLPLTGRIHGFHPLSPRCAPRPHLPSAEAAAPARSACLPTRPACSRAPVALATSASTYGATVRPAPTPSRAGLAHPLPAPAAMERHQNVMIPLAADRRLSHRSSMEVRSSVPPRPAVPAPLCHRAACKHCGSRPLPGPVHPPAAAGVR